MKKLLVLAAIGVAIKYFLDSDKGNEVKTRVRELLGDAQDTLNEYFRTATEKIEGAARRVDNVVQRS